MEQGYGGMPDFANLIERSLKLGDATDLKFRTGVYAKMRAALDRAFEADSGSEAHLQSLYDLDFAIDRAEQTYKTKSWTDRMIEPAHRLATTAKLKYGAIPGIITTISDFVKPILDLTTPIMIGSAAGGVALAIIARFLKAPRDRTVASGAFVCAILFLFSFGWWGAQHLIRGAEANGVIAEIVPGASKVQNALLASLGRIERNTQRTAEGVDKLGRSVDTLKKETSDNPRKELQNLGIPWTSDEYVGVIMRCDMLGIRLFRESGMKMPVQYAQAILEGTKNVSCLEHVRDELSTFKEEACFKGRLSIPFTFAYEKPDHRAFIESFCGEARLREKYPILYGGKQAGPPTGLAAELAAKAPLVLSDEQAKAERERLKKLFPGASNVQPAPQAAAAPPGNGPLNSDEIKKTIVSRNVDHADGFRFWYKPDGSFEQFSGRVSSQGRYRIEADGRICWVDEFKLSGCFQYYRKDGGIYVRGNESNRRSEIGIVKITAR
jgi:hypothetical protein